MLPFSGGNWQTIDTNWWSPNIAVNFAGNPAVEREVSEDVASYGRQIGWLNDIVVALATAAPEAVKAHAAAENSLAKLKAAQKKIEEIKQRRKTTALDTARDALAELGSTDKDGYARLVRSLNPDKPPGAG
jgi:SOS response regulatory protein OraA/RecX